jgi:hypothetical protein
MQFSSLQARTKVRVTVWLLESRSLKFQISGIWNFRIWNLIPPMRVRNTQVGKKLEDKTKRSRRAWKVQSDLNSLVKISAGLQVPAIWSRDFPVKVRLLNRIFMNVNMSHPLSAEQMGPIDRTLVIFEDEGRLRKLVRLRSEMIWQNIWTFITHSLVASISALQDDWLMYFSLCVFHRIGQPL